MSTTILGYLVAYTITTGGDSPTLDVSREQLDEWWPELGLDKVFLPGAPHMIDAFRTATTQQAVEYRSDDGARYRLVVQEMKSEQDLVIRWVMRQGLSEGSSSSKVAEIKFFRPRRRNVGRVRGSEDVKVSLHAGLAGVDREQVQLFVDTCLERYESLRRTLTPRRVRLLLHDYLSRLDGVPILLASAIYFIPTAGIDTARALRTFVERCGEHCRMMLVPVIDDEEQRAMLLHAIDRDVEDRARRTLNAIVSWQQQNPTKPPTPGRTKGWTQEYQGLEGLVARYAESLDMAFPRAADALEELKAATQSIARRFVAAQLRS